MKSVSQTTDINGIKYNYDLNLPENVEDCQSLGGNQMIVDFFNRACKAQARSRVRQLANGTGGLPGLTVEEIAEDMKTWKPVLGQQGLSPSEKAERAASKISSVDELDLLLAKLKARKAELKG